MAISTRPFMGAVPFDDAGGQGVTFRVWAPFASSVLVAGEFNAWSEVANPLSSEGGGYWSTDIAGNLLNKQYQFLLHNDRIASPLWRMDPYARQIVTARGTLNGVIASNNEAAAQVDGYQTPLWNEMVIYETHIRTFVTDPESSWKDSNQVPTGSFTSAITKLDYLHDLGVNVIELMPLGEFLGDISAGYNPAYIFAIENEFGGPDGFRAFVQAAHLREIAVIVDVVYNHLGSPAADMWQFDGWSGSPDRGGIYFYNDWRFHTDWGDRFDYGRGEVRQYLRDNALRWLEQRFADGLRWDSVGAIRNVWDSDSEHGADLPDGWSLCQWINDLIQQRQPWKISIAEDLKDNPWITKATGAGGAGFNAQWGINFFWKLHDAMVSPDDGGRDMNAVAWAIGQIYNANAFQRVIYTESHDGVSGKANPPMARVPELIWPAHADSWAAKKRSTLGAAALLTSPGIPMLFMGQEFLSWGAWTDDAVMDWRNAGEFAGITNLYRDLIHLRRNMSNKTRGLVGQNTNIFKVDNGAKVIAYHRWSDGGPGDDVLVVLNFSNQGYTNLSIGFPRSGMWRVRFNSDWSGYDEFFGNWFSYDTLAGEPGTAPLPFSANVGIGPYSALILSQD